MNTAKGTQIVSEFVQALHTRKGISITRTLVSRNVFQYTGRNTVLLYVKGRAQEPYRWGVTANVIERLQSQSKLWVVILLFESPEKGFLLTSSDVEHYITNVWPLAADGDYKPASGSYLANNSPLYTVDDFIKNIESIGAA